MKQFLFYFEVTSLAVMDGNGKNFSLTYLQDVLVM